MIFEFKSGGKTGLMAAFAKSIGRKIENGVITLPRNLGKGYVKGYSFDPLIRIMIHQYELKEDLVFRRIAAKGETDVITLTFHNVFHQTGAAKKSLLLSAQQLKRLPSVQVTSADINFETFFPAHTEINTIIIAVHVNLIKELLTMKEKNKFLSTIITGRQPYMYEEIISPQMQEVAAGIVEAGAPAPLRNFYLKLKAQELVYLLFVELLKRQNTTSQPLHVQDVKRMYTIRDALISKPGTPPNLTQLAKASGMSESKMKRLFKQIFGSSIYSYYQSFRMNEAAYLIKEQKLSVSEAGYRLGFTNLSHFTRLFEKHIGLKPKKFSLA